MLQGLIPGRIVHYVLAKTDLPDSHKDRAGQIIPAIVVNNWEALGREDGYCNLTGFPDWHNHGHTGTIWLTSRVYSGDFTPGTWHWPTDPNPAEKKTEASDAVEHVVQPAEPAGEAVS